MQLMSDAGVGYYVIPMSKKNFTFAEVLVLSLL